jgi:hypothetical protein
MRSRAQYVALADLLKRDLAEARRAEEKEKDRQPKFDGTDAAREIARNAMAAFKEALNSN